jgi:hypothetical protein
MPGRAPTIRSLVSVSLLLSILSTQLASAAPDEGKMACIAAHGDSQELRKANKLRDARAKLVTCANERCPGVIRKECAGWLGEVDQALPSVVIVAKDPRGGELRNVTVKVDGETLATKLDGTALTLDPGIRKFHFETSGAPALDQELTIRAGEHDREIAITLGAAAPTPTPGTTSASTNDHATGGAPIAAYVLGGIGVVGVAGFAFFGLDSMSKKSKLDPCKPNCAQSDVDAVKKDYLFANISLGVGVVGLGAATYLLLTRDKGEPAATGASGPRLDVAPAIRGGSVSVSGAF